MSHPLLPRAVQNLQKIWNTKKVEMEFTQVEAAKNLGWSQGAISHYLNDVTELNPGAIIKFANFLDVDPREIDPEIETSLPSVAKIPITFDSRDITKPLKDSYILDRKQDSSIIVKITQKPDVINKAFQKYDSNLWPRKLLMKEMYVKLTKISEYSTPKIYAARLKDSKELHFFAPDGLPPGEKIHTLWAVVSCTFY